MICPLLVWNFAFWTRDPQIAVVTINTTQRSSIRSSAEPFLAKKLQAQEWQLQEYQIGSCSSAKVTTTLSTYMLKCYEDRRRSRGLDRDKNQCFKCPLTLPRHRQRQEQVPQVSERHWIRSCIWSLAETALIEPIINSLIDCKWHQLTWSHDVCITFWQEIIWSWLTVSWYPLEYETVPGTPLTCASMFSTKWVDPVLCTRYLPPSPPTDVWSESMVPTDVFCALSIPTDIRPATTFSIQDVGSRQFLRYAVIFEYPSLCVSKLLTCQTNTIPKDQIQTISLSDQGKPPKFDGTRTLVHTPSASGGNSVLLTEHGCQRTALALEDDIIWRNPFEESQRLWCTALAWEGNDALDRSHSRRNALIPGDDVVSKNQKVEFFGMKRRRPFDWALFEALLLSEVKRPSDWLHCFEHCFDLIRYRNWNWPQWYALRKPRVAT